MGGRSPWWEKLSGYNLDKVYGASEKNFANAPSNQPDYAKALDGPVGLPEGLCGATSFSALCNKIFLL